MQNFVTISRVYVIVRFTSVVPEKFPDNFFDLTLVAIIEK